MDISFVIPCYCSEKNLEFVIEEIRGAMKQRESFQYEIILVNDNSKDGTWGLIQRLAKEDPHIVGVNFSKNFGQPSALLAGFKLAKGDYIMTSDDDGQSPVEKVWEFYEKMKEGYDVVCAKFTERKRRTLFRKFGSSVNNFMMQRMLDKPKDTMLSSFFMAKRFIIQEMIKYENPYPYIAGLISRTTDKIGNIEMEQRVRRAGSSGYSFKKLIHLWINGFTAFSIKPLRVSSTLGIVSAVVGFVMAIFVVIRKILVPTIAVGYTSNLAVILVLGGLILMVLGMIGEYVGRIYMCINKMPQYVIESIVKGEDSETERSQE